MDKTKAELVRELVFVNSELNKARSELKRIKRSRGRLFRGMAAAIKAFSEEMCK